MIRAERVDAAVIANERAPWFMVHPPLEQRYAAPKATA